VGFTEDEFWKYHSGGNMVKVGDKFKFTDGQFGVCECEVTGVTFDSRFQETIITCDPLSPKDYIESWDVWNSNPEFTLQFVNAAIASEKARKSCECGAEKVGHNGHSTWCAKHVKVN
jgi:hypothetical protein